MKLSVIIVNYKVPKLLRQCLFSVTEACRNFKTQTDFESEIIVVDNKSEDNSAELVRSNFPAVQLIENTENVGFSKANNQGFNISKGEYILLLNPDTIVPEDLFTDTISFADKKENFGALGVKLIDADGNFQPESKRAYPTPARSFYKLFGLSHIFPNSERFNSYRLDKLSAGGIHEIEILSGAFMLMGREAAEKTRLLDESFFMYGEDIDLSYRILQAGFQNYYYGKKSVLHYKGESTKKDSHKYISVFYSAMKIFADKHFFQTQFMKWFIKTGIFLRQTIAHSTLVFKRALSRIKENPNLKSDEKKILIIGSKSSARIVKKILTGNKLNFKIQSIYDVPINPETIDSCNALSEVMQQLDINEIIFDIREQKLSCFFYLLKQTETSPLSFYTLCSKQNVIFGNSRYISDK